MTPRPTSAADPVSPHRRAAEASSLLAEATSASTHGDYGRAVVLARRALALAEAARLQAIELHALCALAAAEARLGDGEGAVQHGHRALVLLRRSCDAGERARTLCHLVVAYLCVGLPADALACASSAIAAARATGEPSLISWALNRAGSTYRALGEMPRSLEFLEEALRLAREHGLGEEESSACNNLCGALLSVAATQAGDAREHTLARALAFGAQALALAEAAADAYGITMCHGVVAGAHLAAGRLDTALVHALRSRELAHHHGYRLAALTARIICATIERERGNIDAAITLYEQLLGEMRGTDDCDWVVAVHQGLHESHKLRQAPARALEHLEALRHFARQLQQQRAQRQVRVLMNKVDIGHALPGRGLADDGPVACEFEIVGLDELAGRHGRAAAARAANELQHGLVANSRSTDRVIRLGDARLLVIHPRARLPMAAAASVRLQALADPAIGVRLQLSGCQPVTDADTAAGRSSHA